jgi:ATP-dependent Clp protease ATP-binding subunit ClpA
MNEFSDARDTSRLLENAAVNPQSLCAQISKQPFSVVLLDEIEKAHDTVLNLLLQMLDEGILRDVNNREVNFRESIIIATSNAGADQIRAHIDQGQKLEDFEEPLINDLIASHIFKPEFINRFDEIVLFRPLDQAELVQVVDLNLIQINRSLANQKVSVELSPEAKQWLAQTGYDPRLGARPLRRLIQRTVENVVAQHVLNGQAIPGSTLSLGLDELKNANNDKSSHV